MEPFQMFKLPVPQEQMHPPVPSDITSQMVPLHFSLEDVASMITKNNYFDSSDRKTIFYFASASFKWALVQFLDHGFYCDSFNRHSELCAQTGISGSVPESMQWFPGQNHVCWEPEDHSYPIQIIRCPLCTEMSPNSLKLLIKWCIVDDVCEVLLLWNCSTIPTQYKMSIFQHFNTFYVLLWTKYWFLRFANHWILFLFIIYTEPQCCWSCNYWSAEKIYNKIKKVKTEDWK